jgi:predicted XRE-type DNA-binding protein
MNRKHIGSSLESLFDELGEREEFESLAMKKQIVARIELAMLERGLNKAQLAAAMHAKRPQVHRLLDPKNTSLTIATLAKAAVALNISGMELFRVGGKRTKMTKSPRSGVAHLRTKSTARLGVPRGGNATRKLKGTARVSVP